MIVHVNCEGHAQYCFFIHRRILEVLGVRETKKLCQLLVQNKYIIKAPMMLQWAAMCYRNFTQSVNCTLMKISSMHIVLSEPTCETNEKLAVILEWFESFEYLWDMQRFQLLSFDLSLLKFNLTSAQIQWIPLTHILYVLIQNQLSSLIKILCLFSWLIGELLNTWKFVIACFEIKALIPYTH